MQQLKRDKNRLMLTVDKGVAMVVMEEKRNQAWMTAYTRGVYWKVFSKVQ